MIVGASRIPVVVVEDPDGHFVEIAQLRPLPPTGAPESSNVAGLRLRITVANMEQTIAYYRAALGITLKPGEFTKDEAVMSMMGLPPAGEFRVATAEFPGSSFVLEFIEFRGVGETRTVRSRVQDPGSFRLQLNVRDIDETLPLHSFRPDRPYYIGFCLMGAYQDVLGDLHNLFGEAHEVLVNVDEDGRSEISDVLPGETCERVLEYMNYDRTHLLDSINEQLVRAAGAGMKKGEMQAIYREFEAVFPRYTYLER